MPSVITIRQNKKSCILFITSYCLIFLIFRCLFSMLKAIIWKLRYFLLRPAAKFTAQWNRFRAIPRRTGLAQRSFPNLLVGCITSTLPRKCCPVNTNAPIQRQAAFSWTKKFTETPHDTYCCSFFAVLELPLERSWRKYSMKIQKRP